ncbi:MAG TPA: hypothetical protein VFF28_06200 [Candidatus Nanoarchaeia archaeon]|nr:hypothetical protein [Candidatus Nanoarchaeia archaeon]
MQFDDGGLTEKIGIGSGFIFSYLFFTCIIFLILVYANKTENFALLKAFSISAPVLLAGIMTKRLLK